MQPRSGTRRGPFGRPRPCAFPTGKRWIGASSLAAFALAVAVSVAVEQGRIEAARDRAREAVEQQAERIALRLHDSSHPAYYFEVAARDGRLEPAEFRAIADSALAAHPELLAIGYAQGSVVERVAPPSAYPLRPGLDLFRDRASAAQAIRSRFSGETAIAILKGDGENAPAVLILVPILRGDADRGRDFVGFALAVLDLPKVLAEAGLSAFGAEGYAYRLSCPDPDNRMERFTIASRGGLTRDLVAAELTPGGVGWRLEASPSGRWFDPAVLPLYLAASLAALAVAFAVSLSVARYLDSEQRYRLIAENARDVIWTASFPELRFTYVSPSIEQLTGYSVEEVLGRSFADAYPEESAELVHLALENRVPRAVMGDARAWSGRSELRQRRKDGSEVWIGLETTFIADRRGHIKAVLGIARDIEDRKKAERELERLATTDPLTGVANRRLLFDEGARALARAGRDSSTTALMMVDIDHFKALNDERGHQAGDRVLEAVAGALREGVRGGDVVGRYGGEEFVVILPGTDLEPALALGERLRVRVDSLRFEGENGAYGVTASFGVATAAPGSGDFDSLVAAADAALYEAKRAGRNLVRGAMRP